VIIGCKIEHFTEVTSTNDIAAELAAKGAEDGTVIIADSQTRGRGRHGRTWFSPGCDGLYLSVILRPPGKNTGISLIPIVCGLAVADTIRFVSKLEALLKWPNDVLLNSKKVSGILVEGKRGTIIAGIGVNLNNSAGSFPADISGTATSIFIETREKAGRDEFLGCLLRQLNERYAIFLRQENNKLIGDAKMISEILGKNVSIDQNGEKIEGKAKGLDSSGGLILERTDGKIVYIYSGEIIKWR
jgi:BirA family biotin operon repressor/biotin-[acetyl-CoA-carboxylase] ligase